MQVKLQRAVSKMKYMFGQLRHERAALTGHQYVPLAGAGCKPTRLTCTSCTQCGDRLSLLRCG